MRRVSILFLFLSFSPLHAQRPAHGLELFNRLKPVLDHPRCANCHGIVDPISGDYHPGGPIAGVHVESDGAVIRNKPCAQCHNHIEPGVKASVDTLDVQMPWRLPGMPFRFARKSLMQQCEQISDWAKEIGNDLVREHVFSDDLIGLGFEGRAGGAREDDEPADPPPLSRDEFGSRFRLWAMDNYSCEPPQVWIGTIRVAYAKTELSSDTTKRPGIMHVESRRVADTLYTQVLIDSLGGNAHVYGGGRNELVITNEASAGACMNPRSEDIIFSEYTGNGKVKAVVTQDPSSKKLTVRFSRPAYRSARDHFTKSAEMQCGGRSIAGSSQHRETSSQMPADPLDVQIVTDPVQDIVVMSGGKSLKFQVARGNRVIKSGELSMIQSWDLVRMSR